VTGENKPEGRRQELSYVTHLECAKCGANYDADKVQNLCTCGGPLLVRYDLKELASGVRKADLAGRISSMWRYKELLPVADDKNIVTLGEGMTPLLAAPRLGEAIGLSDLYVKDEGLNPTGTFKSRGATTGMSKVKELGIKTVAMPTAGNAGGAWSAYAARAGVEMVVIMPEDAPAITMKECYAYGARTYLVKGLISDAGKIVGKAVKKYGYFDASTLKEPYRIEGKKTMGFEIVEQFGWEVPDAIIYPTGGGVGIIGIWKALDELEAIGWIGEKRPKLISVQAEGCMPIVKAWNEGKEVSEFFQGAQTLAGGMRVPKALGDFIVLRACRETGGTALAVTDAQILRAQMLAARTEGMLMCPEGAAAVAAAQLLRDSGFLKPEERVVILNTGTGLKYPETVDVALPVLGIDDEI
jgi:threonine synthase